MTGFAELRQDVVYGVRMLAKSPGYSAVAVLSLALGIGANTAIFSLIDSVILKMLPVRNPQELVALSDPTESGVWIGTSDGERSILSTREFEGLRDRAQTFAGVLAAQAQLDRRNASVNGEPPEEIHTRLVSGNYFTVLGADALAGRAFSASDERGPGSAPYAVLSYSYWQRRFGGAFSAIGAHMRVAKADLTVIGVAPPNFHGEQIGAAPDAWIPLDMQPQLMPGRMWLEDDPGHIAEKVMWLQVIGRLKPGVTRQQAQANVDVVFKQLVAEEFSVLSRSQPSILKQNLKLHDAGNGVSSLRGDFADPLYVLMAVVALVLLIACANVANLLLARATARQKEIGVRLALGAGRARVVRQFLVESLVLAVAGGLAGAAFAAAGVKLLVRMVSSGSDPLVLDVRPDLKVLLFTAGVCLFTGLIFGLAPAWQSSRVNVSRTLKEAGRGLTGSSARIGLGKLLVTGQIAISVMLLIGAGWFVRTLRNLENVDLGYSRDRLILVGVDLLSAGYSGDRLPVAYEALRDRLARIPGVRAVTYSENGLFSGSESGDEISVEGYTSKKPGDLSAAFDRVGSGYFASVGIPMLLGRDIGPQDVASSESVCVVNETFAKFYFGGSSPIGKHVTDEFPDNRKTFTIVGVARDARDHSLSREVFRRFYLAARQPLDGFSPGMHYEIRTAGDPAPVIEASRKAILAFDPAIHVGTPRTMEALLDDSLRQQRIIAQLSTAFGALALVLAAIGLYGVLSYGVARRTNEIGIRMALGAQGGSVVRMILRETAVLIAIGLVIGVPASLACAKLVQSKLFGLKPADPLTLSVALGVLVAVALASGWFPARRAAKVDPLVALRYE
ncbi:MAG: ABC transporter permease [Bryobacteraceae bacterium]